MSCEGFSSHPCQSKIHSMQSLKAQTEDFSLSEGLATNEESRRSILSTMLGGLLSLTTLPMASNAADTKALSEEYRQGTAALADMDDQAPVPREAYKKLPSGVIYADLRTGNGDVVGPGNRVNMQWVLRKSNGYFVDSSDVAGGVPFIFHAWIKPLLVSISIACVASFGISCCCAFNPGHSSCFESISTIRITVADVVAVF